MFRILLLDLLQVFKLRRFPDSELNLPLWELICSSTYRFFCPLSSKYSIISEISCSTILWPMFRQWRWSLLRLPTSPDIRNQNASNRCAFSPRCFAIISFFLFPNLRAVPLINSERATSPKIVSRRFFPNGRLTPLKKAPPERRWLGSSSGRPPVERCIRCRP